MRVGSQFANIAKTFDLISPFVMNPQLYNAETIERRIESKMVGVAVSPARPKVSIVIPAYNVAGFIRETLDSVFRQTFQDFEVVVINDGSPDTAKLEETLAEVIDRIIYVKQPNGGAAAARNTATFLARGELLAFLDGDDIWEPAYLAMQISKLEQNDFDLIYADAMMFGLKLWAGKTFMQLSPSEGEVTLEKLLLAECNVITSGTVVKREIVLNVGGFDEDREISGFEDFDLWTRIAKCGHRIGYQTDVLLNYRVVAGSLSGGFIKRAERGVKTLHAVKQKLIMNEREETAWNKQLALATAQLDLEKGKVFLIDGRFSEAREFIERSNLFYKKAKLSLIVKLLRISPKLVLFLFKRLRMDEISFRDISKIAVPE